MNPLLAVNPVPLPAGSRATTFYATPNLADAYAVQLPDGASHDPEVLARFMLATQAPWIAWLTRWRDRIVVPLGVKTSAQLQAGGDTSAVRRVSFFRVYAQDATEILLGEDDVHLDFRLSVRCEQVDGARHQVVATTVVRCHNLLGRVYLLVIAPFHRLVVRSTLQRAARTGWPAQETRP
jgi:hypothetical protein